MNEPTINHKPEAQAVAEIVKANNTPLTNVERRGLAIFPNGSKVNLEDERFESFPKRKRAKVNLVETHSFIEYVKAHAEGGFTHLFGLATEAGGSFSAVLDYHQRTDHGDIPRWGDHMCHLELATTPEWRRWLGKNNQPMSQDAFAEFIEDNLSDIIKPDAGILIDVAQSLQGTKNVQFKAGKNLKNGSVQLQYTETITSTGGTKDDAMQVPDFFVLGICPFVGAAGFEINARLRYRIGNDGKVSFSYILDRPFKVIENAFKAAREQIEAATGNTVHLGTVTVGQPPAL